MGGIEQNLRRLITRVADRDTIVDFLIQEVAAAVYIFWIEDAFPS